MNMTDCENIEEKQVCIDYIISLATIGSLFLVSEILPFLKQQKGNGLVDLLICCMEGSDCCLTKLIKCLKGEEEEEKNKGQKQEQKQQQSIKTDEEQHLTNSVNINIQK